MFFEAKAVRRNDDSAEHVGHLLPLDASFYFYFPVRRPVYSKAGETVKRSCRLTVAWASARRLKHSSGPATTQLPHRSR